MPRSQTGYSCRKLWITNHKGHPEHNSDIDLELPEQMNVISGLSGSGKVPRFRHDFRRGQRLTWMSLSAYARQFLGRWTSHDRYIGIVSAISIEQKTTHRIRRRWAPLPKYTIISSSLRESNAALSLLRESDQGTERRQILDVILSWPRVRASVLAPVVRAMKGETGSGSRTPAGRVSPESASMESTATWKRKSNSKSRRNIR